MSNMIAGPGIAGKTCPYCQTPIKPNVPVHVCDACGIPHHLECWQQNGGCTTFGCSGAGTAGVQVNTGPPVFPPAYGQQPQQYFQPSYQPGYRAPDYPAALIQNIRDYLVESILVTLFCCPLLGIIAIVYSVQARTKKSVGDYTGALAAANIAKTLVWVSLGLVLGLSVLVLLIELASGGY